MNEFMMCGKERDTRVLRRKWWKSVAVKPGIKQSITSTEQAHNVTTYHYALAQGA